MLPEKSPGLTEVLDVVRRTGMSAHHRTVSGAVSEVVTAVAVCRGLNPVALQAEVEAWADALDAA